MSNMSFEQPHEEPAKPELHVLALFRGKEKYLYVYDDESLCELIESIRMQVADTKLSLSWYDAAVLAERARQQVRHYKKI